MRLPRFVRDLSLKWKLTVVLVVLALVPMGGIIYVSDASAAEEQKARTGRLLQQRAEETIDKIERNFFERYGDVQAFAFNPMARGTPEEMTAAANYYTKTYGLYDLMLIADANGTVVAANTVDSAGRPLDTAGLLGRSAKSEDWFRACAGGRVAEGESYSRDLHESKWVAEVCRSRGLVVEFAAPVRDENGKVVRVWVNFVSWDRTAGAIVKQAQAGMAGTELQVVSKSGLLLQDHDPKAILSLNLKEVGLEAAKATTEARSGYTMEYHKRRHIVQLNGYAASKGFENYKGFGWGVLVRLEAAEVTAAAVATRRQLPSVAAVAAVILVCVAVWLGNAISRPVRKLVEGLGAVAKGDLTQKAEVSGADEVGRMAAAFNETVAGIRTAVQQERVDWAEVGKQREQNADYQNQLAAISKSQAVIEFALDGTVVRANENVLAALGYTLPEIQGKSHSTFVDPAFAASVEYREFWARLHRGEALASDFPRVGKGGREVWIRASYNPIQDVNGKVVKVVMFASDITATKKIELQAQKDAETLRRNVNTILGTVNAVAGGDFTQQVPDLGADAVGQMGAALNKAIVSVRIALEGVRDVSEQLADASGQLASASEEIATGAQEQASSLEETASTLEEITATVKQNADSAQQARQLASGSKDVAEKGGQVVGHAVDAMSEINQSSKKIAEIITAIDEIAFQTNLLALNAAVEAARAGEQGRGFAVVASEVRNLAQRSATAAKEIKALIQDSVKKVDAGTELVNRSGTTLTEIVTSVKRVTDIVTEIAAASREQSTGIDQVNKAVTQMDSVTQRNASQTEEMSATAQTLTEQAGQLRDLVARFKLGTDSAAQPIARPAQRRAQRPAKSSPPASKPRALNGSARNGRAHELDLLAPAGDDGFTDF